MKRSKSEELLALNHAELDVAILEKSVLATEEEKSEVTQENFLHSVRDLLAGNQGQMLGTNTNSSRRQSTIRNFDLFQVDGNYSQSKLDIQIQQIRVVRARWQKSK